MHIAITGASSGIGEALARELGRWDPQAKLTLVARRRELLEKLAAELGPRCNAVVHDLSVPERAGDWIEGAEARSGPIDVLINNAGIENLGPTAEADLDGAMRVLNTNLLSPLRMTRQLLPAMIARKSGMIVDVASVAAVSAAPQQVWYGASKAGLAAFSEALRGELRGTGVHVLTVYPGPVTTPMAESGYAKLGGRRGVVGILPEGKPEPLARLIRVAMQRRNKRVIYPRFYTTVFWLPLLVRWLTDVLAPSPYRRG